MQEKTIGEIIAEAREKENISQRQLAKMADISNAQLSKIESGEIPVPNPKMLRIINTINIHDNYFIVNNIFNIFDLIVDFY